VAKLRSVLHYNGLPIDARTVSDAILAAERRPPVLNPVAAVASETTPDDAGEGGVRS
jgi:hypothetical protein